MLREVKVGTRVDTLNLLETEWHIELDIGSGVGIVSQLLMIVITVHVVAETECLGRTDGS